MGGQRSGQRPVLRRCTGLVQHVEERADGRVGKKPRCMQGTIQPAWAAATGTAASIRAGVSPEGGLATAGLLDGPKKVPAIGICNAPQKESACRHLLSACAECGLLFRPGHL
ncbi:hypothetical protein [Mangrovicoccus ximenensis]|uniref:hypothetical protein n=1 Tax=Mangrovicoccus ximenensis TaxID=1911570 RepID=UPI001F177216|nr:hypothetical protein [Mangrovicoccus ximenensis]